MKTGVKKERVWKEWREKEKNEEEDNNRDDGEKKETKKVLGNNEVHHQQTWWILLHYLWWIQKKDNIQMVQFRSMFNVIWTTVKFVLTGWKILEKELQTRRRRKGKGLMEEESTWLTKKSGEMNYRVQVLDQENN